MNILKLPAFSFNLAALMMQRNNIMMPSSIISKQSNIIMLQLNIIYEFCIFMVEVFLKIKWQLLVGSEKPQKRVML